MTIKTLNKHIDITEGVAGGKPRIAGRRITVQDIVIWYEWIGKSAEEIAADYDLTLSDIHAALAYYYDNKEDIDKSIKKGKEFSDLLRKQNPSKIRSS